MAHINVPYCDDDRTHRRMCVLSAAIILMVTTLQSPIRYGLISFILNCSFHVDLANPGNFCTPYRASDFKNCPVSWVVLSYISFGKSKCSFSPSLTVAKCWCFNIREASGIISFTWETFSTMSALLVANSKTFFTKVFCRGGYLYEEFSCLFCVLLNLLRVRRVCVFIRTSKCQNFN